MPMCARQWRHSGEQDKHDNYPHEPKVSVREIVIKQYIDDDDSS